MITRELEISAARRSEAEPERLELIRPSAMPTSRKRAIILGLGSLLSERSARSTFPQLESFRLGRVEGFRRVFAHSPSIFVERGIADQSSLEMASLSAEPDDTAGFVCAVFSVPDEGWDAFVEREEEFELRTVPFADLIGVRVAPALPSALSASIPRRVARRRRVAAPASCARARPTRRTSNDGAAIAGRRSTRGSG